MTKPSKPSKQSKQSTVTLNIGGADWPVTVPEHEHTADALSAYADAVNAAIDSGDAVDGDALFTAWTPLSTTRPATVRAMATALTVNLPTALTVWTDAAAAATVLADAAAAIGRPAVSASAPQMTDEQKAALSVATLLGAAAAIGASIDVDGGTISPADIDAAAQYALTAVGADIDADAVAGRVAALADAAQRRLVAGSGKASTALAPAIAAVLADKRQPTTIADIVAAADLPSAGAVDARWVRAVIRGSGGALDKQSTGAAVSAYVDEHGIPADAADEKASARPVLIPADDGTTARGFAPLA